MSIHSVSVDAFNTATIQDTSLNSDDEDVIAATPKSVDSRKENRRKKAVVVSNMPNACNDNDEMNCIDIKVEKVNALKSPLKCTNILVLSSPKRLIKSETKAKQRANAESTPKTNEWKSKSKILAKPSSNLFRNWPSSNVSFVQPAPPAPIAKVKSPINRLRLSTKKQLRQSTLAFAGKLERNGDDVNDLGKCVSLGIL